MPSAVQSMFDPAGSTLGEFNATIENAVLARIGSKETSLSLWNSTL